VTGIVDSRHIASSYIRRIDDLLTLRRLILLAMLSSKLCRPLEKAERLFLKLKLGFAGGLPRDIFLLFPGALAIQGA
jgi:hypothetical protein